MKKILYSILSITSLLAISGCAPSKDISNNFYDELYRSSNLEMFSDEVRLTTKSMYGYHKNKEQGYNSWYYMSGDINKKVLMEYNDSKESWVGKSSQIQEELMVSKNEGSIRKYVSRIKGRATIYGNFKALNSKSSEYNVKIFQNSSLLFDFDEKAGDIVGKYFEIPLNISIGDEIYFVILGKNAQVLFDPVITLENSQNETLYHLNDYDKQYGDVFPYYDTQDKKLKMMYLWTDDCLANNGNNYSWGLDISSNMLKFDTYYEGDNYDLYYEHYNEYFLQRIYDVNRFIDRSLYPFGVRDNFLYKDENRMYLIAGCYRYFDYRWDSDLMIYYSDDPLGFSWTQPGIKITTYNGLASQGGHLPECPSLLKIGNRWYSFVSVSHVTTHQIGALTYWIGEEGKDFTETNWEEAETDFLDGEDLCAARPTHVGDKTYMWGWITADYDGVPLKPWGGYLNLPREIVQREDGSLGGRLDPALTKVLNYGNVYTLGSDNYTVVDGRTRDFDLETNNLNLIGAPNEVEVATKQTRNLITFDVDMKESTKVSLQFKQNNKLYTCSLEKDNDEVWMKIESPDSYTHKVNSKLKIRFPSLDNKYEVKVVADNGIFEFFVNDENALTAKTEMDSSPYDISIFSNYGSGYTNFCVNKLRSYADCEF